jgi:hypothetical protein
MIALVHSQRDQCGIGAGKVHPVPIDPGEYLLADGLGTLTWTLGIGYRIRDDPDVGAFRVPPRDDARRGHRSWCRPGRPDLPGRR